MKTFVLAAMAALLAAPAAHAFRAQNDQEVHAIDANTFVVVQKVGVGPADYWCAAGDFGRRRLDLPAAQRVYLSGPVARNPAYGNKKTVTFSILEPQGADTGPRYSLSIKDVGANLRAAAALELCYSVDPKRRRVVP